MFKTLAYCANTITRPLLHVGSQLTSAVRENFGVGVLKAAQSRPFTTSNLNGRDGDEGGKIKSELLHSYTRKIADVELSFRKKRVLPRCDYKFDGVDVSNDLFSQLADDRIVRDAFEPESPSRNYLDPIPNEFDGKANITPKQVSEIIEKNNPEFSQKLKFGFFSRMLHACLDVRYKNLTDMIQEMFKEAALEIRNDGVEFKEQMIQDIIKKKERGMYRTRSQIGGLSKLESLVLQLDYTLDTMLSHHFQYQRRIRITFADVGTSLYTYMRDNVYRQQSYLAYDPFDVRQFCNDDPEIRQGMTRQGPFLLPHLSQMVIKIHEKAEREHKEVDHQQQQQIGGDSDDKEDDKTSPKVHAKLGSFSTNFYNRVRRFDNLTASLSYLANIEQDFVVEQPLVDKLQVACDKFFTTELNEYGENDFFEPLSLIINPDLFPKEINQIGCGHDNFTDTVHNIYKEFFKDASDKSELRKTPTKKKAGGSDQTDESRRKATAGFEKPSRTPQIPSESKPKLAKNNGNKVVTRARPDSPANNEVSKGNPQTGTQSQTGSKPSDSAQSKPQSKASTNDGPPLKPQKKVAESTTQIVKEKEPKTKEDATPVIKTNSKLPILTVSKNQDKPEIQQGTKPLTLTQPEPQAKPQPQQVVKTAGSNQLSPQAKPQPQQGAKPITSTQPSPQAKPQPQQGAKPITSTQSSPQAKPQPQQGAKPITSTQPSPQAKPQPQQGAKPITSTQSSPQAKPQPQQGAKPITSTQPSPQAKPQPEQGVKPAGSNQPKPQAKTQPQQISKPAGSTHTKPQAPRSQEKVVAFEEAIKDQALKKQEQKTQNTKAKKKADSSDSENCTPALSKENWFSSKSASEGSKADGPLVNSPKKTAATTTEKVEPEREVQGVIKSRPRPDTPTKIKVEAKNDTKNDGDLKKVKTRPRPDTPTNKK